MSRSDSNLYLVLSMDWKFCIQAISIVVFMSKRNSKEENKYKHGNNCICPISDLFLTLLPDAQLVHYPSSLGHTTVFAKLVHGKFIFTNYFNASYNEIGLLVKGSSQGLTYKILLL